MDNKADLSISVSISVNSVGCGVSSAELIYYALRTRRDSHLKDSAVSYARYLKTDDKNTLEEASDSWHYAQSIEALMDEIAIGAIGLAESNHWANDQKTLESVRRLNSVENTIATFLEATQGHERLKEKGVKIGS